MKLLLLFLFTIAANVLPYITCSDHVLDFELKPAGIEQQIQHEAFGVVCKFIYSAEGGTKEHWTITLKRSKDHKDVLCVIERPDVQSYIMFESFRIELHNAHIKNVKIYEDHSKQISDDAFAVDKKTNQVVQTSSFKNEMSKLRIRASINVGTKDHNEEL